MTTTQVSTKTMRKRSRRRASAAAMRADDGIHVRGLGADPLASASCLSAAIVMARPRWSEGGRRAPFTAQRREATASVAW